MKQNIMPTKAIASSAIAQPVTVSFNLGIENGVAKNWFDETDSFHNLFNDELLKTQKACFTLCPLKDGIRLNEKALPTLIFALDFDNPTCPPLESVKTFFSNCDFVIYTTRNHGKDKHGVTCDRYRIVLPLDKPLNPLQLPAIVDAFGLIWNTDTVTKDGARFFYTGNETSLIVRSVGKAALSTDWLLSLASTTTGPQCPTINSNPCNGNTPPRGKVMPIGAKAPHSRHVALLSDIWQNLTDENTCTRHLKVCQVWFGQHSSDKEALKAALPKVPQIREYYEKHPGQWQGIDATINRAENDVLNDRRNSIECVNPTSVVNPDDYCISEKVQDAAVLASQVKGCIPQAMFDEAILINHVVTTEQRAIIDLSCGAGKSLVTTALISKGNEKWIIVKDTIDACKKQAALLDRFGEDDYQLLYGWDENECVSKIQKEIATYPKGFYKPHVWDAMQRALTEAPKGWKAFHRKNDSPCKDCPLVCVFKHSRTHKQVSSAILNNRITIMTHSRFLSLFKWFKSERASAINILIDEEPKCFETVSFDFGECQFLLKAFKDCLHDKVTTHLQGILDNPSDGDFSDNVFYSRNDRKVLQKRAGVFEGKERDLCYRYIEFFSYAAQRYSMTEKEGKDRIVTFTRNRLNLNFPNSVYVLSASARFSMVKWDGFKVFQSSKPKDASGVTVWTYPANTTKNRMTKEAMDFMKYAFNVVKQNGRKRILLCTNKDGTQTKEIKQAVVWFEGECRKIGVTVSDGHRGNIIGRNDWANHDCVIVGYGVFTTVANVVLKTSLYEGREIKGSRVKDSKGVPLLKKGMSDRGLREIDRRMFADEVYQVGLRGIARNWQGDSMDIVTAAPSPDYVFPLKQVLNGCRVVFGEIDYDAFSDKELHSNPSVLARLFGSKNKGKDTLERARIDGLDILAYRKTVA